MVISRRCFSSISRGVHRVLSGLDRSYIPTHVYMHITVSCSHASHGFHGLHGWDMMGVEWMGGSHSLERGREGPLIASFDEDL